VSVADGEQLAPRFFADRYMEMLEVGRPAITAAVRLLAEPGRLPAVFFCAAGKDRTGVVAALLLSSLGVDDEAITADYHTSHRMIERPNALYDAPEAAMLEFLDRVRRLHGDAAGYLRASGVADEVLERLRAALISA
jgi:protein-tyrosine phosphatase